MHTQKKLQNYTSAPTNSRMGKLSVPQQQYIKNHKPGI